MHLSFSSHHGEHQASSTKQKGRGRLWNDADTEVDLADLDTRWVARTLSCEDFEFNFSHPRNGRCKKGVMSLCLQLI